MNPSATQPIFRVTILVVSPLLLFSSVALSDLAVKGRLRNHHVATVMKGNKSNKSLSNIILEPSSLSMSPTCRRHVHMSPISRRHCMLIRHIKGSDSCFLGRELPTPNKTHRKPSCRRGRKRRSAMALQPRQHRQAPRQHRRLPVGECQRNCSMQ